MWQCKEYEKALLLSLAFTFSLLTVRIIYTGTLMYGFYVWNTVLAVFPYLIGRVIKNKKRLSFLTVLLLFCWLLFLPNAPYLITDVFHFRERENAPFWFDLFLVISASWNGLLLCLISIMHIDSFFSRIYVKWKARLIVSSIILLCSYGVYLGRYCRFNSWEVFTTPVTIFKTIGLHFLRPQQHIQLWAFTILFSLFFMITYYTIVKLMATSRKQEVITGHS